MNGLLLNFCKCGCGNRVKWHKAIFCRGHQIRDPEIKESVRQAHLGSKRSPEARAKMSAWQIGRKLPQSTREKMTKWRKAHPTRYWLGKKFSAETKKKWSLMRRGKNNPNWKGGISSLINNLRTCDKYQKWKIDIFVRDTYICDICKQKKDGQLNAHHKKEISKILKENKIDSLEKALACKELWDLNNGITFCKTCHIEYHRNKRR